MKEESSGNIVNPLSSACKICQAMQRIVYGLGRCLVRGVRAELNWQSSMELWMQTNINRSYRRILYIVPGYTLELDVLQDQATPHTGITMIDNPRSSPELN